MLHRYVVMLRNEWATLEARLAPSVVPPLSTLKQGVVVLGRQWKNAIYTPYMLTYSLQEQRTKGAGQCQRGRHQQLANAEGIRPT